METREQLIAGLQKAVELMKEITKLQDKRVKLRSQYIVLGTAKEPWDKKSKNCILF